MQAWFKSWFNTTYYHLLYFERNENEAQRFIDSICEKTELPKASSVLDMACGKGRHSIYLNKKGMKVDGFDLSEKSIQHAKQFENDHLHFYVHDMRSVFRVNYFDAVFSLFSSFGYFDRHRDNEKVLLTAKLALKAGGTFVLDFMNADYVKQHIKPHYEIERNGIQFKIRKRIENHRIIKNISFEDKGVQYHFEEKVWLYETDELMKMLEQSGFKISDTFGNYHLQSLNENSDRLIIFAKRV